MKLKNNRASTGNNLESFIRLCLKLQEGLRPDFRENSQDKTLSLAHALGANPKYLRNYG